MRQHLVVVPPPQFKTMEEMVEFLKQGIPDIENFDSYGKTRAQFFAESKDMEVRIEYISNVICRVALTVKVLLFAGPGRRYLFREQYRVYANGKQVSKPNPGSMSETRRRGETAEETVIRGVGDECGINIREDQIEPLNNMDLINYPECQEEVLVYDSTAYYKVKTIAHIDWRKVTILPNASIKDGTEMRLSDNGVEVYGRWEDQLRQINDHNAVVTRLEALP